MKIHIHFLLLLVLSLSASFTSAQEQYMFKHLVTKDGLSHSQVNYIFKDSSGFMWFATGGGLNRYDGYQYKIYRCAENDTLSIIDNYINRVQEDADGNLWVDTAVGYVLYDSQTERFVRNLAPLMQERNVEGIPTVMYVDKLKNCWFYVPGKGAYYWQRDTNRTTFCPQEKDGLSKGWVTDIKEVDTHGLFLFDDGRIEFVEKETGRVVRRDTYISARSSVRSGKYSAFVDKDNDLWVYSKSAAGVWMYNSRKGEWKRADNSPGSMPYRLTSNVVQDIAQDATGKIWLATDHGGINIIRKENESMIVLQNNVNDERTIANNSVNCLCCDDVNTIWVGTYKKGISYYNETMYKFGVDHLTALRTQKNFDGDITFLEVGKDGQLWMGTNGSGLIRMNHNTGEKQLYEHRPGDPSSLSSNVIVSLCAARDGRLWVGTYLGGMNCFDGKRFVHYRHEPGKANSLADDNVWSIVEDEKGMIWIGTLGNGLQRLNPATGEFTTYFDELSSPYVSSLCFGKDSNLYIGTAVGLVIYDPRTGTFQKIRGNVKGTQPFSNQNIHQVYEDSRGLLWIATRNGLNVFDRRNDRITILRKSDGLADNIVYAVIEDTNKNMWITTPNGITNIVVNTDPKNGNYYYTCYNYDELDGLQDREFNIRSIVRTYRGEILMGGIRGYNILRPDAIRYNHILPKVVFTGLSLFNEDVQIGKEYGGNCILSTALSLTRKIELEYRQNVFSIAFSGMNYILPEKTRYAYMLEGFSTDWLFVDGSTHQVTYTNLAPGTYTLKVKAANSDGYWNEEATTLTLVIRPPFWRSAWAYMLYGLMLAGLLLYARTQILRREREKFKLQQVELEAARMHELDDMKLRFFTNVSHEFRTPLTLILTPMEYLISHTDSEENKQKLVLVRRNALRLLNLVNQLLDFRKGDVSRHRLTPTSGDIVAFLQGVCQSFLELSEKKNIHLRFVSAEQKCLMIFDEDKLGRILINLLSNAFKFTPSGGQVEVRLCCRPATPGNSGRIDIQVADSGVGVPDEDKLRVFERFYQGQQHSSELQRGSGVGLHLVNEFVTLHGGEIHVEDNPGGGSVFVCTLSGLTVEKGEMQARTTSETEIGKESEKESGKVTGNAIGTEFGSETDSDGRVYCWEPEEESEVSELPDSEPSGNLPLILIVEDNDDFRSFLSDSLQGMYRICEAANGKEAWNMIPGLQPDIIISDVMMPEMDGCELCRLVKNDIRTSHIPLILLTARTAEEQKIEGLSEGADDYITKPFNFEILLLRIRKLIEAGVKKREQFQQQIDPKPSEITITSLDEKLIAKAIRYVEDNIGRSELSVEEMSRELGMSRVHLYKKLLTITGKSPIEFIRVIRLKRAAQLLRESQMNVSEIAYEVGFNNPKYFSKYFKEEFGKLPSEYKNNPT